MPICCEQCVDPPAAAVDDDGLHADQAQQCDVARESGGQRGVGHRAAAEPDHQCRRVVGPDVRERLGEDAGLLRSGNAGGGHGAGGEDRRSGTGKAYPNSA